LDVPIAIKINVFAPFVRPFLDTASAQC
jgi:hypothetical protein